MNSRLFSVEKERINAFLFMMKRSKKIEAILEGVLFSLMKIFYFDILKAFIFKK